MDFVVLFDKVSKFVDDVKSGAADAADKAADVLEQTAKTLREFSAGLKETTPENDQKFQECCDKLAEIADTEDQAEDDGIARQPKSRVKGATTPKEENKAPKGADEKGALPWGVIAQLILTILQNLRKK